jgi:hypothetical protein
MNFGEILDIVWTILAIIAFIGIIIFTIKDIKKSNKYWDDMFANLEVFKASMKKEHDLLKRVQAYGEWLDTYHSLMHTNVKLEDSEFNNGTLTAAGDCLGEFLNTMGEYVDGKESSD